MAITKNQSNQKTSSRAANAVKATNSQTPSNKARRPQSQNSKVEKEPMPMGKMNYILMGVSLLLIVVGFILMSGSSNEGSTFNDDVFSSTRIVVAPLITFIGFLCMIPAILYKGRKDDDVPHSLNVIDNSAPTSNIIINNK